MAAVGIPAEVAPMDAAHEELFDIRAGRNCMGMATFEYVFSRAVDESFLSALEPLGPATFPLGRSGGMVKIDVPEMLLVEGILGLRRLRITLRLGVDADKARAIFERALGGALPTP